MINLNDKERYIYNYLNSRSSTISFYVPKILEKRIATAERENYIERIKQLIIEIRQIISTLNITRIPINGFFNQVYLLRDCGIPEVDALLENFHYELILDAQYAEILRKASMKSPLSSENKLQIEFLITNHLVEDEDIIFEYLLRNVLLKAPDISYDAFELMLIDYTKMRMRKYISNPKCKTASEEEILHLHECTFKDTIYLSSEDVQAMYSLGVYKVLKSMFHSLGHVIQYKNIVVEAQDNPYVIKEIKEEILSAHYPGYYENNASRISYEAEAETFAISELMKLFNRFNLDFRYRKNPYLSTLIELTSQKENNYRTVDGCDTTVDELFLVVIYNRPELLESYPQLSKEYTCVDGNVVVKNDETGGRRS